MKPRRIFKFNVLAAALPAVAQVPLECTEQAHVIQGKGGDWSKETGRLMGFLI